MFSYLQITEKKKKRRIKINQAFEKDAKTAKSEEKDAKTAKSEELANKQAATTAKAAEELANKQIATAAEADKKTTAKATAADAVKKKLIHGLSHIANNAKSQAEAEQREVEQKFGLPNPSGFQTHDDIPPPFTQDGDVDSDGEYHEEYMAAEEKEEKTEKRLHDAIMKKTAQVKEAAEKKTEADTAKAAEELANKQTAASAEVGDKATAKAAEELANKQTTTTAKAAEELANKQMADEKRAKKIKSSEQAEKHATQEKAFKVDEKHNKSVVKASLEKKKQDAIDLEKEKGIKAEYRKSEAKDASWLVKHKEEITSKEKSTKVAWVDEGINQEKELHKETEEEGQDQDEDTDEDAETPSVGASWSKLGDEAEADDHDTHSSAPVIAAAVATTAPIVSPSHVDILKVLPDLAVKQSAKNEHEFQQLALEKRESKQKRMVRTAQKDKQASAKWAVKLEALARKRRQELQKYDDRLAAIGP